jgi:superfamily II DNA/RNA helicase
MALRALVGAADVKNGIVFCNRKSEVDVVSKSLKAHGFDAAAIHGDLDQSVRTRTLESFRKGELRLLVASDVAARGLDIPDVSHVFNFDVPHHADDYVHRIGRTGRAGRSGQAFMIITPADSRGLDKVLKLTGKTPQEVVLDIDFSQVGSETRAGGRESPRGARSSRGRERGRPREVSDEAPAARAPAQDIATPRAEPVAALAPEPAKLTSQRQNAPRAAKPAARPAVSPAQTDGPARGRDRERDDDRAVVGFGSDTPAFLMRAPPRAGVVEKED